ncbi:hypothetical protein GOY17_11810 [Lysobacter soli]|uniref:hypothetical protein n=1 Tax=Lysobacter soli TaxID=453783 RepID=UPI0012ED9B9A|nr:hypothetical protein [Lysobacter soli]QGW65540.1 hypothetical protein GOY17_11810 [Lysobacter soli]
MRWKQLGMLGLFIVVTCALAPCAVAAEVVMKKAPVLATMRETRAMMSVVLKALGFADMLPPPEDAGDSNAEPARRVLLLVDRTLCLGSNAKCDSHLDDLPPHVDAFAPRGLLDALVQANAAQAPLDLSGIPGTAMIGDEDVSGPFRLEWWSDFYRRFPDAAGYVQIAHPVLDDDRNVAVMYVTHWCSGLCASGTLIRLERTPQGWRVAGLQGVWVS